MGKFEKQLEESGYIVYTNKGVSMLPLLREGKDIMVISKVDGRDCKLRDVVLFVRPHVQDRGHYVLHRILRVNEDGTFWIVGDNCVSGETVKPECIIGRLDAVIRDGKKISVTDWKYRLYVHVWCDWYQGRFLALRIRNKLFRIARAIKRRIMADS